MVILFTHAGLDHTGTRLHKGVRLRAVRNADRWRVVASLQAEVTRNSVTIITPPKSEQLTPREVEVVKLIALGESTKGIAQLLGLSIKTVASHRLRAMSKIRARNAADVARFAIRMGLVQP
jgi:DNA-binding NarL/FixJ family response regulator